MTAYPVHIGARFGDLTVVEIIRGRKNHAPSARCVCTCGNYRTVRPSSLRKAQAKRCKSCSSRRAWSDRPRSDTREVFLAAKEQEYRSNAKVKGLVFDLTRDHFRSVFSSACDYCGTPEASGVDRVESDKGYIAENVVPCCSSCNYAKRSLSRVEFLDMVGRIYRHSIEGQIS